MTGIRSQRSMKRGPMPTICLQLVTALFKEAIALKTSSNVNEYQGDVSTVFEIPPTPRLVASSGGQASNNATVRHWEILRRGCNSPTGRNYVPRSRKGQCPIAQTKRHHRAKLCRPSSVTLLENSSPRHGHEERAHFARRDYHARAKPA